MRRRAFVLIGAVCTLAAAAACSRAPKKAQPVAALSSSPQAAAEFAPIRAGWETRKLEPRRIDAFLARYPHDGAAPLAKTYLAFAALDQHRLAFADGVLASIADVPAGTTRDLATVARARSLRLHGAPRSALESLRRLVGKMVDDADREIFLEELALSSIAAHDEYEAIAYLDAWLRGVGEDDKERVRTKIEQILDSFPRPVLEQTYRTMRARGVDSGYGSDTQKLVAERLARIAVQANDAALARWLVDQSGVSAAQTGGDAGLELGELAASRRGLATFAGRTVGLLLPTGDRRLGDEAADVVRGVSWSLDLPRRTGAAEGARLVTRDDGVDVATTRAALEELAGEGAAVVIGAFDRASAERAVAWSEERGIPLILLAAPDLASMPKKVAVVLGERPDREVTMLGEALARQGATTVAVVADTADDAAGATGLTRLGGAGAALRLLPAVRCDIPLAEAGRTRFPLDAWLKEGAKGWLVAGPQSCARDVLRDLGGSVRVTRASSTIALTLEAGLPLNEVPRGLVVLSAAAGIIPVLAPKPENAPDADVRGFMEQLGVRPSWWTALGHDAGALAKAALAPLPVDTTTDPKAIAQRRALVQAGLVATRVRLWTSDEKGIGPRRALERSLRLVSWQKDKK